jgi:hypothetical protein
MRPVPRSFALPRSVQTEQSRYRRWAQVHGFVRFATAAVSALLVLFLTTDALLGAGYLRLSESSAPRPDSEELVQREMVTVEVAAEGEQTVALTSAPAPETEVLGEAGREGEAAAEGEILALEAPAVKGTEGLASGDEGPAALLASPVLEAGETSLPVASAIREAQKAASPEQGEPSRMLAATPPSADEAPIEAPAQEGASGPPTLEAARGEAADGPATDAGSEAGLAQPASGFWRLWGVVRIAAGALLGVLLVLLAGLLWTGQKRRL